MAKVFGDLIYIPTHGTLAEWEEANPILLAGQEGIATDGDSVHYKKVGDGVTPWNDLPWKTGPKGEPGTPAPEAYEFNKIVEACCDVQIVSQENYNLFKISEVSFRSKLQDSSAELATASNYTIVSGWIPVEYGKYYTMSILLGDARTTYVMGNNSGTLYKQSLVQRMHVKKADGTILFDQKPNMNILDSSQSTYVVFSEDIVAVRFQVTLTANDLGIDFSTEEKLRLCEPMFVEGDTPEQAYENALNYEYMDGDYVSESETIYSLKKDENKADKAEVEVVKNDVSILKQDVAKNRRLINEQQKYNSNYIPNERFIRSIANLRDETKSRDFEISIANNSGATIKNAGIVVGLHNTVGINPENNNLPFQIYDDTFSEPIGFKFFDGDKELPYYIESESDCNYITDKNFITGRGTQIAVLSDGRLVGYNTAVSRMQISSDDGLTWTNICDNITSLPHNFLLSDSRDNLFVASSDGYRLYKYTPTDGYMTGTQVIDMEEYGTKVGAMLAEDSDENLYLGTYQEAPWRCTIRKSTDHGDTWSIVFDTTECQHVHNIFINTKVTPNEIFIGLDNNIGLVQTHLSTDAGATWTLLDVPYTNNDNAFRYAGENFYIGCGERSILGGATMYKTSDYNDPNAYYTLFDNSQRVRSITNVIEGSDDILIAGGCVDYSVRIQHLFLSEDKGETWKTVLINPQNDKSESAGHGLRQFTRKDNQILSVANTGHFMRFVYGNGARTTLAVVNVGDIPVDGKTITLKTGYVANVEQMEKVLTSYEQIEGKVADIQICNGYVIDNVSNKRVLTEDTELTDSDIRIGQTSEYKILENHAYRLNGNVNLGKLSRLNFTKGFTVSMLFRKEDGKNYLADDKYYVIFQTGDTKFVLYHRSLWLMSGETNMYGTKLHISDPYLYSDYDDYMRLTVCFTDDELPIAKVYTGNQITTGTGIECTEYPITENFSENDFIVGNALEGSEYADIPNIARIEIYNRVLTHGEIMSLTNGCNLITDGSTYN